MSYNTWSLELAHVNWGSPEASESIVESVAQGADQIERWRAAGESYVICLLVDDKELRIGDHELWLANAKDEFPQLFELVDILCFESSLISLKEEFLSLFDDSYRPKLDREIERYRRKHGRVGCSHDIAIWHALRLGSLASGERIIHRAGPRSKGLSPYATRALSILEEEDKPAEERAMDILKRARQSNFAARINVEYYA